MVYAKLNELGLTTSRLILIAAGFIAVYFGFTIVGNRYHQYQLDRENTQLEQRIVVGQNQQAQLQALRDWMQSDGYVEQMAREQGMIRPGDHAVIVAAPTAVPVQDDSREWWQRYFEP